MKVYVLTIIEICDYEQVTLPTRVFFTIDEAREELKKWRDGLMEAISGCTWIIGTDEADVFDAYELGRAAANSAQACITMCEVIGKKPPFFERYAALKQEEIDGLRDVLEKAGGSYRFENTFIKVCADLGGFTEDYEFCIVRSAELDSDGTVTIEVESNYQLYNIRASDVMGGYIHYIAEEIEA